MKDLISKLKKLLLEVEEIKSHLNPPQKEQRALELQDLMQDSSFWNDSAHAQSVSQEFNQLQKFVEF